MPWTLLSVDGDEWFKFDGEMAGGLVKVLFSEVTANYLGLEEVELTLLAPISVTELLMALYAMHPQLSDRGGGVQLYRHATVRVNDRAVSPSDLVWDKDIIEVSIPVKHLNA